MDTKEVLRGYAHFSKHTYHLGLERVHCLHCLRVGQKYRLQGDVIASNAFHKIPQVATWRKETGPASLPINADNRVQYRECQHLRWQCKFSVTKAQSWIEKNMMKMLDYLLIAIYIPYYPHLKANALISGNSRLCHCLGYEKRFRYRRMRP